MARSYVDMKRGTYPWPDGRQHKDANGEFRTSSAELLRSVGLSPSQGGVFSVFDSPEFKKLVSSEIIRRDQVFSVELSKAHTVIKEITDRMQNEILVRLKNDPESIPVDTLLTHFPKMVRLEAESAGRKPAKEKSASRLEALVITMVQNNMIPTDHMDEVLDNIERSTGERMDRVKQIASIGEEIVDVVVMDEV